MSTFSRLKSLKIAARTAKFVLDNIDTGAGAPEIDVRFAGEANAEYWRANLRKINENRSGLASGKVTEASIDASREMQVSLFANHVIVGWAKVMEDGPDGSVVPCTFSPAKCEAFLQAILESDGSDVWNALRAFCMDADNFRDGPAPASGADLGKP